MEESALTAFEQSDLKLVFDELADYPRHRYPVATLDGIRCIGMAEYYRCVRDKGGHVAAHFGANCLSTCRDN